MLIVMFDPPEIWKTGSPVALKAFPPSQKRGGTVMGRFSSLPGQYAIITEEDLLFGRGISDPGISDPMRKLIEFSFFHSLKEIAFFLQTL